MSQLRVFSFHSVKGGVGKSTLATLTALSLARDSGGPVYLLDTDLTGTSLADVLPLCAPTWEGTTAPDVLPLEREPSSFLDVNETKDRIVSRSYSHDDAPAGPVSVPFLNDYLLFADASWDESRDLDPRHLGWRLAGAPESLAVLPSSALPGDLQRILPLIFDEEHSAFLQGRLEYLLAGLLVDQGSVSVVIDAPPAIPGLSRAVLSMAVRLGRPDKVPLSEDGLVPPELGAADIDWRAIMVTSEDLQDLRAMARWWDLAREDERTNLRVMINRAQQADADQRAQLLRNSLGISDSGIDALLEGAAWLDEGRDLRIFREPKVPSPSAIDRIGKLIEGWT